MTSYGEREIIVNSRIVGRIRVLLIEPASAIYPCLQIRIGVTLHDNPTELFAEGRPQQAFEMRAFAGELRLTEQAQTIGPVFWTGHHRSVRSSGWGNESQIDLRCDLDPHRIERLEEHRAGGELRCWLVAWPTLIDARGYLDCEIHPIDLKLPRETWLPVLGAFREQHIALTEVVFSAAETARFEAALQYLREGRSKIDRGDGLEALAACRKALEAGAKALGVSVHAQELEAALGRIADPRTAKHYAGIITRLKELAALAVHDVGEAPVVSRREAQFVLNVTENVISLLAQVPSVA